MTADDALRRTLTDYERVASVRLPADAAKPGNQGARYLPNDGFEVVQVNPGVQWSARAAVQPGLEGDTVAGGNRGPVSAIGAGTAIRRCCYRGRHQQERSPNMNRYSTARLN